MLDMLEALPLIVTTLVLVSAFVSIVATTQLEDVRLNWEKRRCEPLVMMMAQMVPKDPNIDTSEFASENFKFCIGRFIDSSLAQFFKPILGIFDKQIDLASNLKGVTNNMNKAAGSLMNPVANIFDTVYKKFTAVLFQVIRIFYKIQTAIDRVFGIATASVFAGISMYKGIQNTINFIVTVILIILAILVILVIWLWFVMFPLVPIILTTIGIVSATAVGASAAGMGGAFCVAPGTKVIMENGYTKPVEDLQPGNKISEGIIEGVLKTTGKGGKCVVLKGITISSSHLVHYSGKWIPAGEHPEAVPATSPEFLYCLNTSSRTWKVLGTTELLLRDWEELPETDTSDLDWEATIFEMLNRLTIVSTSAWSAPGRGLLGSETLVYIQGKGVIHIKDVEIGDIINDANCTFTQVLGIYKDTSERVPISGPNQSAWMWLDDKRIWRHPLKTDSHNERLGYHLITQSGTFVAANNLMRDFTEVGSSRIHETYARTLSLLEDRNV
jgi:hypothetical protein